MGRRPGLRSGLVAAAPLETVNRAAVRGAGPLASPPEMSQFSLMSNGVTLKDVVRLGRLHLATARYVLNRPEALPGMPPAGSRGMQRKFSLRQAVQLAMAAHLVRAGFSVETAGLIVGAVEEDAKRSRYLHPPRTPGRLYGKFEHSGPAMLTIIDETLVCLSFSPDPEFPDLITVLDPRADGPVSLTQPFLCRYELNLTLLEAEISKGFAAS